jgi:hypothetical protein
MSQSMSRSVSLSSATQPGSSEHTTFLEDPLSNAQKTIQELEAECHKLETMAGAWKTHHFFTRELVSHLRARLQKLELQELREEARQKEQQQAEDEARRKRRADTSRVFAGPLNKTRRKEELGDIAAALALPDSGKKDALLERIFAFFEEHPELKKDPRFEGLFSSRQKRPRSNDIPEAGPSNTPSPPNSGRQIKTFQLLQLQSHHTMDSTLYPSNFTPIEYP